MRVHWQTALKGREKGRMVGREERREKREEEGEEGKKRKGRDRGHQACESGGATRRSRQPGPPISTTHLREQLLHLLSYSCR
eukprot:1699981-Rhodomonas_salina.1